MAPTAAALSLDAAVGYSLAASLAYSPPAELRRGSGGYQQRLAPRLAFSQQVEVDRLRASATLFEMEEQDGVCVAFRGSTDLKNYLSMFNLFFEPSRLGTAKGGRVHRGYQEASLELYDRLSPLLASRQPQRLAFIGHSYGGGTATLCALAHAEAGGEAGGEASSVDEVVTFAGPRVGDTQFAMGYDELLGERTTHYVPDPAPHRSLDARRPCSSRPCQLHPHPDRPHQVHDLDPVLAQNQPLWCGSSGRGRRHVGGLSHARGAHPRNALGFVHTGRRVRCAAAEPRQPRHPATLEAGSEALTRPLRGRRLLADGDPSQIQRAINNIICTRAIVLFDNYASISIFSL